jgi:hypothetical protein
MSYSKKNLRKEIRRVVNCVKQRLMSIQSFPLQPISPELREQSIITIHRLSQTYMTNIAKLERLMKLQIPWNCRLIAVRTVNDYNLQFRMILKAYLLACNYALMELDEDKENESDSSEISD